MEQRNIKKTQKQMLKTHFEHTNNISNIEAQAVYKIRALPRRISDLKDEGYVFNHEWKTDLTGQRYMRYFIVSAPTESNDR
tara:strand:- start:282 stop:524 length:243 start_codon:yes stop_codon:yes gene_type:complete